MSLAPLWDFTCLESQSLYVFPIFRFGTVFVFVRDFEARFLLIAFFDFLLLGRLLGNSSVALLSEVGPNMSYYFAVSETVY
jgi:hypothetical protein